MSSKEIKALRQAGNLEEALSLALKEFAEAKQPVVLSAHGEQERKIVFDRDYLIWPKRALAWVYYDFLKMHLATKSFDKFKEILVKILELQFPEDENMIFDNCAWQIGRLVFALQKEEPVDYGKINQLFDTVKAFHFSRPSEAFSFIYKAFHKGYKNWSNYLEFADWWNFENFRPEDFLKEEFEGKKIMSIAEQAHIAYASKLLEDFSNPDIPLSREEQTLKINLFITQLDKIIESHPDFQYPQYFKAKLLLAIGDQENVLSALLPFAKTKRNDFWVWEVIADAFQEKDKKIACLCKALSLKTPEDFTVKTHQKLAKLLIDDQRYPEAKTEIEKIIAIRKKNEWRIPNEVINWRNQVWFHSADALPSNSSFYKQHLGAAEEILFSDVPELLVAVEFVNTNKGILNFVEDEDTCGFFKYSGLIDNLKVGDILKVRFAEDGKDGFFKALTIRKVVEEIEIPAIKKFQGKIKINTSVGFGFVEDVFIDSKLIQMHRLTDGQSFRVKAILSFNKKKNEWGWKAIDIE
jgi:tetratricopeptide (TPR) repeat protein